MIGRILLTVVVIFRILIVAIVGETVYDDEQEMFVCNTLQPGCNQACYDQAFPISHIRLCFITYSVHQSSKQKERGFSGVYLSVDRTGRPDDNLLKKHSGERPAAELGELVQGGGPGRSHLPPAVCEDAVQDERQEGISRFYIIQVVFRNMLEVASWWASTSCTGSTCPRCNECDRYPCIKDVECYVSRPTEKTVFLVFMFAISGVCVVFNLAELNHLGWKKIKEAVRGVQARRKSVYEIRKKDPAKMSGFGHIQSSDSAYV
ncbi:unnamed protein product [Gadus morhua 'NCC']